MPTEDFKRADNLVEAAHKAVADNLARKEMLLKEAHVYYTRDIAATLHKLLEKMGD